jgi:hypothetical protein
LVRDIGGDGVAYFLSIINLPVRKYFLNCGQPDEAWDNFVRAQMLACERRKSDAGFAICEG